VLMNAIKVDLPSDILLTINETESELQQRIKNSLAISLYVQEKVTLGKAAQIANLSRYAFESLLSSNNISISLLEFQDVLNDMSKLK